MLKKALMATAITFAVASAQAQVLLAENFNNINTLAASGWVQTNLSSPAGSTNWFQGDVGIFAAQSGASDSYIAANYSNSVSGGSLSNWLISPTFSTALAGTVSFWAKAELAAPFFDQLAVGFSNGSSATTSFTLGTAMTVSGDWTQYSFNYAAQGAGSVARFAIAYVGADDNADYVGIDTFAVTATPAVPAVPEPTTWALMGAGLVGVALGARRSAAKRTAV